MEIKIIPYRDSVKQNKHTISSYGRNCVVFDEDTSTELIVFRHENIIIATCPNFKSDHSQYFIPYAYVGADEDETGKKWEHVICKLARKDNTSKYFGRYHVTEHCKNGYNLENTDVKKLEEIAAAACLLMKEH